MEQGRPPGPLVEREAPLAALQEVVAEVRRGGHGRLVLVTGEAGSGKTSLVRALLDALPPELPRLVGSCDSLRTPRPFGPLLDWFPAPHGDPVASAPREQVFERAHRLLAGTPTVAVLEDVHWADEATLDLLSFLSRRLDRTSSALLVSYRADEVGPQHLLTTVLGELATARPLRVAVGALSVDGVARLADGHDVDPGALHARTAGNPFFVSECLAAPERVPLSVREAVLGRAGRLPGAAREALDVVAAVPGRVELWLADALGAGGAPLDACVAQGLLVADGSDGVRFRHELAREAVHDALLPARRREVHRRALAALREPATGAVDHARVVHHAAEAGDVAAVQVHAPLAAAAAEAAGARREAVAHLELALRTDRGLAPQVRLDLWERLAEQRAIVGRHAEAVVAYERAVEVATELGDDQRRASLLTRAWNPLSMAGRLDEAERLVGEALHVLERQPPSGALALAYAQRCSQHMLARELLQAEPWGRRAIDLATEVGDDEVLAYALVQSGVALWMGGDDEGLERLRRGVALGRERGLVRLVATGLSQIGSGGGEVRRYGEAVAALEECVAFADQHELGSRGLYAQAWLGRCHLELGRWEEASVTLDAVLRSPRCEGITRLTALTAIGRLRARRGDPGVREPLDEALLLARRTGHLQRLWPVAAARAEAADARGELAAEVPTLQEVHELARRQAYPWAIGELGWWLVQAGALDEVPGAATPYALHLAGDPVAAARAWEALGCVYEQAVALADSPDDADQLAALAVFTRLGAAPAAQRLVTRRRARGLPVPRGPNAATLGNPAGLTAREVEVLRLVAAGCTDAEVGSRLHISTKTAGHHVSHALGKLGARTRAEAVAAAVAAGVDLPAR